MKKTGTLDFQKDVITISNGFEVPLTMFDTVPRCTGRKQGDNRECNLALICDHDKKSTNKCGVMMQFISHYANFYMSHSDKLDELTLNRVGTMLMPLYAQLCRFQMEQIVADTILEEKKTGTIRVHPIFKSVRDSIKDILKLEERLGIEKKIGEVPEIPNMPTLMNPNLQ